MPNWCYNSLKITGNKEKTREFLRFGFKNPEYVLPEKTVDIEADIENLPDDQKLSIKVYYPQPDIIKAADTTNHPEDHPEIAEQQRNEFGVVGWYAWSKTYWGTKWSADFENVQYVESDEHGEISLNMDTAWAPPIQWLDYVQEKFPELDFEMEYSESGCCFCGVAATHRDEDGTPEICDMELDWDEQQAKYAEECDDEGDGEE
jgi:hypothetical protein